MNADTIYKVVHFEDKIYQVYKKIKISYKFGSEIIQGRDNGVLFEGTLPECESFINLKEKGNM